MTVTLLKMVSKEIKNFLFVLIIFHVTTKINNNFHKIIKTHTAASIISTTNQEMSNGNENFSNNKSIYNGLSTVNSNSDETAGTGLKNSTTSPLNNMTMTRIVDKRE